MNKLGYKFSKAKMWTHHVPVSSINKIMKTLTLTRVGTDQGITLEWPECFRVCFFTLEVMHFMTEFEGANL